MREHLKTTTLQPHVYDLHIFFRNLHNAESCNQNRSPRSSHPQHQQPRTPPVGEDHGRAESPPYWATSLHQAGRQEEIQLGFDVLVCVCCCQVYVGISTVPAWILAWQLAQTQIHFFTSCSILLQEYLPIPEATPKDLVLGSR